MLTQDYNKSNTIQESLQVYQRLQGCLDKFPALESKTQHNQLHIIQNKYKYFLKKYEKTIQQHAKYKLLHENIQKTIEQSNPIKQQNQSIDFIKKIMESTEQKYNILEEKTNKLKEQKYKLTEQTIKLKQILIKIKREYTQLLRNKEEIHMNTQQVDHVKEREEINKNMFKIRLQKKKKMKENFTSEVDLNNVYIENSFFTSALDRKVHEQFSTINTIKEQFLSLVGLSLNQFYRKSQKSYDNQSFINQLVKKREFKNRNKFTLTGIENYDPKTSAVEVFRINKEYQSQKSKFMNSSFDQMMNMIISKNKIGQVLHLIESQKKQTIDTFHYHKLNRSKLA